jgi:hypothetical protein
MIKLTVDLDLLTRTGAEPAPQVGGQIEKKAFGEPKLEKIIKFGVKF